MRRKLFLLALLAISIVAVLLYYSGNRVDLPAPDVDLSGADPQFVEAVERARAEVADDRNSASVWGRYGMLLGANGYFEQAANCFQNASRLDSANSKWLFFEAFQYLNSGRLLNAISPLRSAAELPSKAHERSVFLFYLASAQLGLGQLEDAEETTRSLERLEPDSAQIRVLRGSIASMRGNDEEALQLLLGVSDHPSARKRICVQLARTVDSRTGKPYTRLESCATMPPDQPWPNPFMVELFSYRINREDRAEHYKRLVGQGRIDEASEYLQAAVGDHPNAELLTLLGQDYANSKKYAEAERAFRQALERESKNPRTLLSLAEVQFQLQNYPASIKTADAALAEQGNLAQAHVLRGRAYRKLKQRDASFEAYRDALRCRPESAEVHLEFGEALAQEGNVSEGVASLEAAVQLAPNDPRAKEALDRWKAKSK